MHNNSLKPIEKIAIGDTVASYDHQKGRRSFGIVKRLFKRSAKQITKLAIAGSLLLSTPGHKIYCDGDYQSASELTTSSELLSSDGKHLHPSSISSIDSTATVYNFEVSDYHNYYAGDAKVLVHNECAWAGIKQILVNSNNLELFDKFHDAVHALNIGSSERKLLFTSVADLGDNAPKFILDFIDSPSKLSKFAKEAGLVDAWAVARKLGDEIRRNPNNLGVISDYIRRSGKSTADVVKEIPDNLLDAKKWIGNKKLEPFLDNRPNIHSAITPEGYEIYNVGGRKYIRRKNALDPYTPRLMVDENNTIIGYTKPIRNNSQPAFIRNLKNKLGDLPKNHQRHHLIPVGVVDKSPLHQEAIRRGLYSVDRASNGRYLAETADDFKNDLSRLSSDYPTHLGSHPKYDDAINKAIDDILELNDVQLNNVSVLSNNKLESILLDIEEEALDILRGWNYSKLN
jgi:hypothetical protein